MVESLKPVIAQNYFSGDFQHELQKIYQYQEYLSLIILDCEDILKLAHETLNQNEILNLIRKNLRANDYVVHFSSEEFVVLLPLTTITGASSVAQRLWRLFSKLSGVNQQGLNQSIPKMGLASYQASDRSINSILERAREAVLMAKNQNDYFVVHPLDLENSLKYQKTLSTTKRSLVNKLLN